MTSDADLKTAGIMFVHARKIWEFYHGFSFSVEISILYLQYMKWLTFHKQYAIFCTYKTWAETGLRIQEIHGDFALLYCVTSNTVSG